MYASIVQQAAASTISCGWSADQKSLEEDFLKSIHSRPCFPLHAYLVMNLHTKFRPCTTLNIALLFTHCIPGVTETWAKLALT
mmetsp:Transcript_24717/g.51409  ORF Transcript_24717/g.51409 Transcript_24717/m.51409 type:complete len:83 (+) Transcript_24717:88-336(+)